MSKIYKFLFSMLLSTLVLTMYSCKIEKCCYIDDTTPERSAIVEGAVAGTVGTSLAASTNIVIKLSNDTIKNAISKDMDLSSWIPNLPGGLTAKVESEVAAGATEITITISGTPTITSDDVIVINIPGVYLGSNEDLAVAAKANVKYNIKGPTATIGDVTISGDTRDGLTNDYIVTITISNDEIKEQINEGFDLKPWITNLPNGLDAVATDNIPAGATEVKITVSGMPTVASNELISVEIPAEALANSSIKLIARSNENAKYNIVAFISATIRDSIIGGMVGESLIPGNILVELTNDEFKEEIEMNTPLNWIKNLPSGLEAKAMQPVAIGAKTILITISGKPTVVSNELIRVEIPADKLLNSKNDLVVTENENAHFNITASFSATIQDVTVAGNTFQALETTITIKLNGDTIKEKINGAYPLTDWIKNLPSGLEAKATNDGVSAGATEVKIIIYGEPSVSSNTTISIVIPKSYLSKSENDIIVTHNDNAKYDIKLVVNPNLCVILKSGAPFSLKVGPGNTNSPGWTSKIEYFIPNNSVVTDWSNWTGGRIAASKDESDNQYYIYLRGTGNYIVSGNEYSKRFNIEQSAENNAGVIIDGNMMSLLDFNNANKTILVNGQNNRCFQNLFSDNTSIIGLGSNFKLPATQLASSCYNSMFKGCTNLTSLPNGFKLPATTLADYCYNSMFEGCTKLASLPDSFTLPAVMLKASCYSSMFKDCSALTALPDDFLLESQNLDSHCYSSMFQGCTSLESLPDGFNLPAEAVGIGSYACMFLGCSALTALPDNFIIDSASKIFPEDSCYFMFKDCTKLTSLGENFTLSAQQPGTRAYESMFEGCKALASLPDSFTISATELTKTCCQNMFKGCSALTALPGNFNLSNVEKLAESCFQSMFEDCTSLESLPASFVPTNLQTFSLQQTLEKECYASMFKGCTKLSNLNGLSFGNANTLKESCCQSMFQGCTSLKSLGENFTLSGAETLAPYCYASMFEGCTNLEELPQNFTLPEAATLANYCYASMFKDCKKITQINLSLPAETLTERCYASMFEGCTELQNIYISLPATATLAPYCYASMFKDCTNLEELSDGISLPAETLTEGCYASMFEGCTKLANLGYLFLNNRIQVVGISSCEGMFRGCSSLTTLPYGFSFSANVLAESCYKEMFKGCSSLTTLREMDNEGSDYDFKFSPGSFASYCCQSMFEDCESLTLLTNSFFNYTGGYGFNKSIDTNNINSCFDSMFKGCSNLEFVCGEDNQDINQDNSYRKFLTLDGDYSVGNIFVNMFEGSNSLRSEPTAGQIWYVKYQFI